MLLAAFLVQLDLPTSTFGTAEPPPYSARSTIFRTGRLLAQTDAVSRAGPT